MIRSGTETRAVLLVPTGISMIFRSSWLLPSFFLIFGVCACGEPLARNTISKASVQADVSSELAAHGVVRVFIHLREPVAIDSPREERKGAIEAAQSRVLSVLGSHFVLRRRFLHVPAIAGEITQTGLDLASTLPDVVSVQIDGKSSAQLAQAVPLVGANTARTQYGFTGRDVLTAIIDTGVDTAHADLRDSLKAQHCFTQGGCPPSNADEGSNANDDNGHGTNVAGIVTSNGTVSSIGYAPDTPIVAVKVLKGDGTGANSDWVAGLDWIYDNLATQPVSIINMSLGSGNMYTSNCDASEAAAASVISQLIAKGVTVFAASGNDGSSKSIQSPACITGVIAVGATYDGDNGRQPPSGMWVPSNCFDATTSSSKVSCFTNSSARLDILAPGAVISSTGRGGTTSAMSGTSQASPGAAAVGAILKQCNPSLTPDQLRSVLKQTGMSVTDSRNGLMIPSIRVVPAIQRVCGGDGGVADGGGAGGADGGPRDGGQGGVAGAAGGGGGPLDSGVDGSGGVGGAAGNAGQGGSSGRGGAGGTSTGGAAGSSSGGAGGSGAGTGGVSGNGGAGGARDGGESGTGGVAGRGGSGAVGGVGGIGGTP
ncbi:MAG: S8 family serine peptidase, partial [Polyangiaceae bacterium]